MGVFEFIIALVLISTLGKALSRRRPRRELPGASPEGGRAEIEHIRDTLDDVTGRLGRLEEERDFYKDLLDSSGRLRGIPPPDLDEDTSDTGMSS